MRFHRAVPALAVALLLPGVMDAAPGDVVRTVHSPASRPHGLAFDGKRLWVADHYRT